METAKILIVDDDPDLRCALKLRLRASHYQTLQASDGYSTTAVAQRDRPDLIILDLGLPAGDGYVVLERLQDSDSLSEIPVIVPMCRDAQSNEQRALQSGAIGFYSEAGG
jgi:DNA-binding response OmpR family regulator